MDIIFLDVYKYFSLSKSFLKLDLINCIEFMITGLFIWYTILKRDVDSSLDFDYILLGPEIFMFILIFINNWHGHYIVKNYDLILSYLDKSKKTQVISSLCDFKDNY
jgi:hypothetical protein